METRIRPYSKRARAHANHYNSNDLEILDTHEIDSSGESENDFAQGQTSSESEVETHSRGTVRRGKIISRRHLQDDMDRKAVLVSTNTNFLGAYSFCFLRFSFRKMLQLSIANNSLFHTIQLMNLFYFYR